MVRSRHLCDLRAWGHRLLAVWSTGLVAAWLAGASTPPLGAADRFYVVDAGACGGETARVELRAELDSAVQAYSVSATFDPSRLALSTAGIRFDGAAGGIDTGFTAAQILDVPGTDRSAVATIGVIPGLTGSFDDRPLVPGGDILLCALEFSVIEGSPAGDVAITIEDRDDTDPITSNAIVRDGDRKGPAQGLLVTSGRVVVGTCYDAEVVPAVTLDPVTVDDEGALVPVLSARAETGGEPAIWKTLELQAAGDGPEAIDRILVVADRDPIGRSDGEDGDPIAVVEADEVLAAFDGGLRLDLSAAALDAGTPLLVLAEVRPAGGVVAAALRGDGLRGNGLRTAPILAGAGILLLIGLGRLRRHAAGLVCILALASLVTVAPSCGGGGDAPPSVAPPAAGRTVDRTVSFRLVSVELAPPASSTGVGVEGPTITIRVPVP